MAGYPKKRRTKESETTDGHDHHPTPAQSLSTTYTFSFVIRERAPKPPKHQGPEGLCACTMRASPASIYGGRCVRFWAEGGKGKRKERYPSIVPQRCWPRFGTFRIRNRIRNTHLYSTNRQMQNILVLHKQAAVFALKYLPCCVDGAGAYCGILSDRRYSPYGLPPDPAINELCTRAVTAASHG